MKKQMIKIIAVTAVVSMLAALFCGLTVSGAASDWYASAGNPGLSDSSDGDFCSFSVNASAAVSTKKSINLLEEDIVLNSLSIADGYWGLLGFRTQTSGSNNLSSDPAKGKLPLLIEPKKGYYRLFFWKDNKGYDLGNLPFSNEYTIRILKKSNDSYAMQINSKVFTHSFIDKYGKKGFFKNSYISLFASNWMKGNVGISEHLWDCDKAEPMPIVYQHSDGVDFETEAEESVLYSKNEYDFLENKLEISDVSLSATGKFSVCLNKNSAEFLENTPSNGDALSLTLSESDGNVEVTLNSAVPVILGIISHSDIYSIWIDENDGKYGLKINGTVLSENSAIDKFAKSEPQSYVAVKSYGSFKASLLVCRSEWYQYRGNGKAMVRPNADGSRYIYVTAGQNVVSPKKYDLLKTGIKISNLVIPEINTLSHGALIYLGKSLSNQAPCVASANAISLLIEKTKSGMAFNILNSNGGTKVLLGTVAESDEYSIKFIKRYKRWVLAVNDAYLDINIKTDSESLTAAENISDFLNASEKLPAYIAFAANNFAGGDIDVFSFEPPEDPEGFSVITDSGVYNASGNENDGYSLKETGKVTVLTNNIYKQSEYSLFATRKNEADKFTFWISKTDAADLNFEILGESRNKERFAFVIEPADGAVKAKISVADENFSSLMQIGIIDYDWSRKHAYDIRKAQDGNWYFAIDAEILRDKTINSLNEFMNSNIYGELFYGLGSENGFDLPVLKIAESPVTPNPIDEPGWKYFSDTRGELLLDADGTYSVSKPDKQIFAFTNGTYDITKTSVSLKVNSVKEWFYFSISSTGIEDSNPLPSGNKKPNRAAFVIVPQSNFTRAQINIWSSNFQGGLVTLDTIDYDWNEPHIFDVRMGTDGHWYLWVDNIMKSSAVSHMLDSFIERNGTSALRYGIGGFGGLDAEQIKITEQIPGDNYIDEGGWNCYNGVGGRFSGNQKTGYSCNIQSGTFAYTKLTYDIDKTAISLKIDDIGGWFYFCISDTGESTDYLPVGAGDKVNKVVFVITPYGMNAQFGHWAADGKSSTVTFITSREFDWFGSEHTFDIRRSDDPEDENWYLCVDGRLLMNRVSGVLNQFMQTHSGQQLHYGIGGFTAFAASDINVVEKPKLQTGGDFSNETVEIIGDYEFDLDFDNLDDTVDYGYNDDFSFEDNDIVDAPQDPRELLEKVNIRKRRLIKRGHGIIFEKWEIALMIAGGAVLLGGAGLTTVLLIKRKKRKKLRG